MTRQQEAERQKDPFRLLLVDDNPADVRLAQEALREKIWNVDLTIAKDGIYALEFLQSHTETNQYPNLILLDLNMPRKDGRQLLAEIKQDQRLQRIPVVVLSTSGAERDISDSYDLGASAYICKPVDLDNFMDMMHTFGSYWFQTVTPVP